MIYIRVFIIAFKDISASLIHLFKHMHWVGRGENGHLWCTLCCEDLQKDIDFSEVKK